MSRWWCRWRGWCDWLWTELAYGKHLWCQWHLHALPPCAPCQQDERHADSVSVGVWVGLQRVNVEKCIYHRPKVVVFLLACSENVSVILSVCCGSSIDVSLGSCTYVVVSDVLDCSTSWDLPVYTSALTLFDSLQQECVTVQTYYSVDSYLVSITYHFLHMWRSHIYWYLCWCIFKGLKKCFLPLQKLL